MRAEALNWRGGGEGGSHCCFCGGWEVGRLEGTSEGIGKMGWFGRL